jgi:hypothetical protein
MSSGLMVRAGVNGFRSVRGEVKSEISDYDASGKASINAIASLAERT